MCALLSAIGCGTLSTRVRSVCVCRDFLLSFPAGTFSLDWHIFAVNLQENQYLYTIWLCYIVSQQWFTLVARGFAVS